MERFSGSFALDENHKDTTAPAFPKRWVSCGDYQCQDIDTWQGAIRKEYGKEAASEIKQDGQTMYFEYDENIVDFKVIGKRIGITHSGPSLSSSSSSSDRLL